MNIKSNCIIKIHTIIFLLFFLSGVSSLIYEVVWMRMLVLVFGNTVFAVSTILTSFMAGLALGSFYFGKISDKIKKPLTIYAFLEIGTGIYAVLMILLFSELDNIYILMYRYMPENFYVLSLLKFSLCFLIILVPTTFMGGTLPLVSKFIVKRLKWLGKEVGGLYGINTFGAVFGCILAGFFLIESVGITATICIASFINFSIGIAAYFLGESFGVFEKEEGLVVLNQTEDAKHNIYYLILIAYGLSGFAALAYEVAWMRLFSLMFYTTVYAFSIMLAIYLCGIALGSFLFGRLADKIKNPLFLFGILEIAIGFWVIFTLPLWSSFPSLASVSGHSFLKHIGIKVFLSVLIMIIPTVLMGASFPLVNKICTLNIKRIGQNVGSLYSLNTVGCIFGSFICGFILIPALGLQKAIFCIAVLNIAIGAMLFWFHKLKYFLLPAVIVTAGIGILISPKNIVQDVCAKGQQIGERLIYFNEDIDTTAMVFKNTITGNKRLMVNTNQYVGENSPRMMRVQKWQAHLPLLLHPHPEHVLIIGMGAGITASSATLYDVDLTICEISPAILKASVYFLKENRNILANPNCKIVEDDGRNYLQASQRKYNVIMGDLYNAANAGVASLYTKQYYQLCLRHLTDDGLMCQWLSLKDFPEKDLKAVIATFHSVFPHTTTWFALPDVIAVIGTKKELKIDLRLLNERQHEKGVEDELREIGLDNPFDLLSHFLMNEKDCGDYVGNIKVISDNRPYIEFSIPKSLHYLYFREEMARTLLHLYDARTPLVTEGESHLNPTEKRLLMFFKAKGRMFLARILEIRGLTNAAISEYRRALSVNPEDRDATFMLKCLTENQETIECAIRKEIEEKGDASSYGLLASFHLRKGMVDKAIIEYKKSIGISKDIAELHYGLAKAYERKQLQDKAEFEYKKAIEIEPKYAEAYIGLGNIYGKKGLYHKAIINLKTAIKLNPKNADAHLILGFVYRRCGRFHLSLKEYNRAFKIAPYSLVVNYELGKTLLKTNRVDEAIVRFERAIEINPDIPNIHSDLAKAFATRGKKL